MLESQAVRCCAMPGPLPPREAHPTVSLLSRRLPMVVVAAVTLLATVPFLDKAFHIDDNYYLQVARQILKDPVRPYSFSYIVEGREQDVFLNNWSPPFFQYCLALGIWSFGENEVALHGITALFTACAAVSMYVLAVRFSVFPVLATTVVVLSPLLIPSQNVMLDVPMLALGLAGLACYVSGVDRGSWPLVLCGGLLAGLAVVTKYPAVIVFPLMALYAVVHRSWLGMAALVVALLPLTIWCIQNQFVHGSLHVVNCMLGGSDRAMSELASSVLALLTILGSGFVPIWLVPRTSLSPRVRCGVVILCITVAFSCAAQADRPWLQIGEHFLFLLAGLYVVAAGCWGAARQWSATSGRARGDTVFVFGWLVLAWLMPLGSYFIAVRHVLWALPPAALLVTRMILTAETRAVWRFLLGASVGGLGLAIGWADREQANLTRSQVSTLETVVVLEPFPTYYLGEDGFAYYGAAAKWRPLMTDRAFPERQAVVLCSSSTAWSMPPAIQRGLRKWTTAREVGRVPATTMAPGVNFYRTGTADLPWEIGRPTQIYVDYYWYTAPGE